MSLSKEQVKTIFLQDDILPLGKFESLPVASRLGGLADSYPFVTKISDGIDYLSLLEEARTHMNIVGFTYVKNRIPNINPLVDEETLRSVLGSVGFYKGSYQSYSLRKLGTNELEDWVLPKTRELFDNLPVKTFRQQYAVAAPGWNIKLHRDHSDFRTHGFRAMVPLSADVYMAYEDAEKRNIIFKLERGGMYFVNIAKMHRGFNESEDTDRVNLIMQMDSDEMLFGSSLIKPMTEYEISKLPSYARTYGIWDFGYEL